MSARWTSAAESAAADRVLTVAVATATDLIREGRHIAARECMTHAGYAAAMLMGGGR